MYDDGDDAIENEPLLLVGIVDTRNIDAGGAGLNLFHTEKNSRDKG